MFVRVMSCVACVAISVPAYAADLQQPVFDVVQVGYGWDGFYAGLHGGYVWSDVEFANMRSDGVPSTIALGSFDSEGAMGGMYAGYNRQFGSFVLGGDNSISFGKVDGLQDVAGILTVQSELDMLALGRARVGFAFDRFLVYAAGGLAVGRIETVVDQGGPAIDENYQAGWTIGAGIEAKLAGNWSARLEYAYVDLGSEDYLLDFGDGGGPAVSHVEFDAHMVRAGIAYHFGGDRQPVAAEDIVAGWGGMYVGVQGGYAWGDAEFNNRRQDGSPAPTGFGEFETDGGLGGLYAGYNNQFGRFVLGFDASFSYADIGGGTGFGVAPTTATINVDMDFLATSRARIGVDFGRVMVFGAAGVAAARIETVVDQLGAVGDEKLQAGWTVGGGVEAKLTGNWSARAEYLYVDLGDEDYPLQFGPPGGAASSNVELDAHIVRAGIAYHF